MGNFMILSIAYMFKPKATISGGRERKKTFLSKSVCAVHVEKKPVGVRGVHRHA